MNGLAIESKYSTKTYTVNFDVSAYILEPFEKPKDKLPLWSFCELLDQSKGKRGQEFYSHVNAMILDFDSNKTIEEFKSEFSHFFFYLYTTSSHTKDLNKFRVILPLLEPIEYKKYVSSDFKEALCRYFVGVDPSSFVNFHYLPNLPKNKDDYDYFFNQVDRFFCEEDLTPILNTIKREKRSTDIYRNLKPTNKNYTQSNMSEEGKKKYRAKVFESLNEEFFKIPSFKTGDRYTKLTNFTVKIIHQKYPDQSYIFDLDEIWGLIKQNCDDRNVKNMVESMFKKIRTSVHIG